MTMLVIHDMYMNNIMINYFYVRVVCTYIVVKISTVDAPMCGGLKFPLNV